MHWMVSSDARTNTQSGFLCGPVKTAVHRESLYLCWQRSGLTALVSTCSWLPSQMETFSLSWTSIVSTNSKNLSTWSFIALLHQGGFLATVVYTSQFFSLNNGFFESHGRIATVSLWCYLLVCPQPPRCLPRCWLQFLFFWRPKVFLLWSTWMTFCSENYVKCPEDGTSPGEGQLGVEPSGSLSSFWHRAWSM